MEKILMKMEKILMKIVDELVDHDFGVAQENIDAAITYLGCAIQNLRQPTKRAAVQSEQKAACKCGWATINQIRLVNVDCPIHGMPLSDRSAGG